MAAKGEFAVQFVDYDNEGSTFRVTVPALTAANFDAQTAAHLALLNALAGITLGSITKRTDANVEKLALGPADAEGAQRELKWLVSYHDTTTYTRYSCDIPTADTAQLDPDDRKHANIGDASYVDAFVTAFEAAVKSPVGNAVVVDEITLVGRML